MGDISSSHRLPDCTVVSGDRAADVWPYVCSIWHDGYHLYRGIMPQDFPAKASKETEEAFLREFFPDFECHVQGYRFMKSVWFAMAELNFYTRLPKAIKHWFEQKENEDIIHDPSMRKFLMHPDAEPKTLFDVAEIERYGAKFLKVAMKGIQWHLEHPETKPGIHGPESITLEVTPARPVTLSPSKGATASVANGKDKSQDEIPSHGEDRSIDFESLPSVQEQKGEEDDCSLQSFIAVKCDISAGVTEGFDPPNARVDSKISPPSRLGTTSNAETKLPATARDDMKVATTADLRPKSARKLSSSDGGFAAAQKQTSTTTAKTDYRQSHRQSSTWPQDMAGPKHNVSRRISSAESFRGNPRYSHPRQSTRPPQLSHDQALPFIQHGPYNSPPTILQHRSPHIVTVQPSSLGNTSYPVPGGYFQPGFVNSHGQILQDANSSPNLQPYGQVPILEHSQPNLPGSVALPVAGGHIELHGKSFSTLR